MLENMYLMEMTVRWKAKEIERAVAELRAGTLAGVRPSPVRSALAAAIVRFGMFLSGNRYTCPDAAPQR
jgi:hypothetical protein